MPDQPDHPDVTEPLDALSRVVTVMATGQIELDPEDIYALSRLPTDNPGAITELVQTLDAEARFALVQHLQGLSEAFGGYELTTLFGALIDDEDASVRSATATALGVCETARAAALLIDVARAEEEVDEVRQAAVDSLADVAYRLELGWASSEEAEPVIETLRALAEDPQEEEQLRASALSGLAVVSETWVAPLIDAAFESDSAAFHFAAIEAMGRTADVVWLPVLEGVLVVEDEDERLAAIQAIGEIGSEEGTPLLVDLFSDPTLTDEHLEAVVSALGEIGDEEALQEIENLSTHPDARIRERAQVALAEAVSLDSLAEDLLSEDAFPWSEAAR